MHKRCCARFTAGKPVVVGALCAKDPVYTSEGSPRRPCLYTTFLWAEQDQSRMWEIAKDELGVTEVWGTPPPLPPIH